ncbi:MAG: hypothetical protein ISS48_02785 [Candidatus Aenigmarchaeota archaeon]|nr:hypothetical protein [Candidatus Aenigmarchaeota archaeon]
MVRTSFLRRDILDSYGNRILGTEIYRDSKDVETPEGFLRDPEGYLERTVGQLRTTTIYETDRSTIFKIRIGNRELFVKRMNVPTNIQMYHDMSGLERMEGVVERGENEIFTSSRVSTESEVRTSAEVILSGVKHHLYPGFYIFMTRYPPGIFMDDFLLSTEHLSSQPDEIRERLLLPLAETMTKIHGCVVEGGRVHHDLHPGNIYLTRPKIKKNPYGIIVLDWENSDYKEPIKKLNEGTRKRELQRFIEARERGSCKASLSDREFDALIGIYWKIVNQEM